MNKIFKMIKQGLQELREGKSPESSDVNLSTLAPRHIFVLPN